MSTQLRIARLKKQLSAHRRALQALRDSQRKLHRTVDALVGAFERPPVSGQAKRSKGVARNGTPSGRRSPKPELLPPSIDVLAAALERRWANLF